MCGGAGTRLDRGEKPLFEVGGKPMVERVLDALEVSHIDTVHAVTSPKTPGTARRLEGEVDLIEAAGDGYVGDLTAALESVAQPVLTIVSDLPLVTPDHLHRTIDAHNGGSMTVCVPVERKCRLGVSVDTTIEDGGSELAPTGLNIVGRGSETIRVSDDDRLAVNVNRPADAAVAEALLAEGDHGS
jgi:adenosylcobinamide-phosphate guanylyltransferase